MDNNQLVQQVALLTAQMNQLQNQQPVAAAAVVPRHKCPVATPDKFDGTLKNFPTFLAQCQLYLSLRAEDFPTDLVTRSDLSSACYPDAQQDGLLHSASSRAP